MQIMLVSILLAGGFMLGCGIQQSRHDRYPERTSSDTSSWASEIRPVLNQYCRSCHEQAGFMQAANLYQASAAKRKVSDGSMPPAGSPQLTPDDRDKLLGF